MHNGYFRFPTVHNDNLVFVSEDDLWQVGLKGGLARRLTSGLGAATNPIYSTDGRWLAFSSEEEGHREVFVCDASGGEVRRVTYMGSLSTPVAWSPEGKIIFRSKAKHPHSLDELFQVSSLGGMPEPLRLGPAIWLATSASGEVALERNSHRPDPAHWKRYRGGTAGVLWVAGGMDKTFKKFLNLKTNFSRPMWVGSRLYFISDHEGVANIYSAHKDGSDLKRHTKFKDYYCRNAQTDGKTIVFHAGGDLYTLDIVSDKVTRVEIDYRSQRTHRQRKFVNTARYLESYTLSPNGEQLQVTVRGQVSAFKNWEGPAYRYGKGFGVRYRQADWLDDGKSLIVVSDDGGDERLELYTVGEPNTRQTFEGLNIGRVTALKASPKGRKVAVTNHRSELVIVDLDKKTAQVVDRSEFAYLNYCEWSPDGRFVAYSKTKDALTSYIAVYVVEENKTYAVTKPSLLDQAPSWDPEGKYLYFLSTRILDPVYDNVQFELSFPRGVIPCLVTLRQDQTSPFIVNESVSDTKDSAKDSVKDSTKEVAPAPIKIDFEGIEQRVQAFPVSDGRYLSIKGLSKGKVAWTIAPIKGALKGNWLPAEPEAENRFEVFDFETRKAETVGGMISNFEVSQDRNWMVFRIGKDLRVVKTGEKPDEKEPRTQHTKKSGWIDLERARTMIEPASEWRQMLHEVWRLQRDHFWDQGMSKIDWNSILPRYHSLIDRVNTRSELSDLVWEVQGELGTSHAYDIGGDYRPAPHYGIGLLGAEYSFDGNSSGYRIDKLIKGDIWRQDEGAPLMQPGVQVEVGDILLSVNGEKLSATATPAQLLMNRAGDEVELMISRSGEALPRRVHLRTIKNEMPARYRDWVDANRAYVAKHSQGKVGYIHIPDMGPRGFSEFHRSFLAEYDRDALIVDVRFNGGGHVSQLLLEKLARTRLGVSSSRWFGTFPKPDESPAGALVALTNENAGSDGDIFSHTFKMRKLGPLIGKRTWGGVVGIWPRHALADGSVTTQPEYATWFSDVGWGLENYGVDPDIEVEFAPHHYYQGEDPQLARAVEESLKLLKTKPPFRPKLEANVDMRAPELI